MEFRTIVDLAGPLPAINHSDPIMMLGSCFTDNVGERLRRALMDVTVNPFGTLYNPASIAAALRRMASATPFAADELTEYGGAWHSLSHHSRFSSSDREKALAAINGSLADGARSLRRARHLILTFGTAWVYRLKATGEVVANCHKIPADRFTRERLTAKEIAAEWLPLIGELRRLNPELLLTFTVSPIRHLADGAHGNQLSKAELLLAVDAITAKAEGCHYFPAYEIVVDELRDYRFYAADMTHPSDVAADYVAERLRQGCFTAEARAAAEACERLYRRASHRPLTDNADAIGRFRQETARLAGELAAKMPYLKPAIEKLLEK